MLHVYDGWAVQLLSWLCEISPFGKQVVLCLHNENIMDQWLCSRQSKIYISKYIHIYIYIYVYFYVYVYRTV